MGCRRCPNRLSYRLISLHCPMAARAYTPQSAKHQQGGRGEQTHLDVRQMLWLLEHIHAAQANANGAGGDDDHLVPVIVQLDGRLDDERQDGEERLARLLVDDGACA